MHDPTAPLPCDVSPPVAAPRGWVGDPFGVRVRPHGLDYHTGIDIGAPPGWPVLAVLPGIVRAVHSSGELTKYGNLIVLEHGSRWTGSPLFSLYAHLQSRPQLELRSSVNAGRLIGAVGDTAGTRAQPDARTVGPHLHFELLRRWPPRALDVDRLDPAPLLERFGLILRRRSRIEIVRGSAADCTARALASRNDYARRPTSTSGSSSSSSAGLLPLALLWFIATGDVF